MLEAVGDCWEGGVVGCLDQSLACGKRFLEPLRTQSENSIPYESYLALLFTKQGQVRRASLLHIKSGCMQHGPVSAGSGPVQVQAWHWAPARSLPLQSRQPLRQRARGAL